MLRDLYPPLPNPHLLSSSGAAATAMTVSLMIRAMLRLHRETSDDRYSLN
jgi:hypothetical protein